MLRSLTSWMVSYVALQLRHRMRLFVGCLVTDCGQLHLGQVCRGWSFILVGVGVVARICLVLVVCCLSGRPSILFRIHST